MPDKPSIVVCGASLAGIAAAIRLKQLGYDPLVLDKSAFPRPKLCGEFLGPDSFPCLETLGMFDAVHSAAYGPVRQALFYGRQGIPLRVNLAWMSRKHPYALAISRETLDPLLLERAREMGMTVLEKHRVLSKISSVDSRFQLEIQPQAEESFRLEADILLDATGRHGGLFAEAEPQAVNRIARFKSMVGLQCHAISTRKHSPDLEMFFFPGGYGGIQPLSEHTLNICMLVQRDFLPTDAAFHPHQYGLLMERTIGQNPVALERLRETTMDGHFQTTANLNLNLGSQGTGLLQIGDAMITLDPFTGSGMAHALQTGLLAAETVATGLKQGQSYAQLKGHYLRQYHRQFGWRLRLLRSVRPLLFSEKLQHVSWPLIRPMLPALAAVFR